MSYDSAWYQTNRERILAEKSAAYWSDPEKFKARVKADRTADPEKYRDRQRGYRAKKPWRHLLLHAAHRAKAKGWKYDLTTDWAEATFTGFCALTRIPFVVRNNGVGPKFFSPSIDRINSSLGYTQDNCRFVLWSVNALHGTGSDVDMLRVAEALVLQLGGQL